MPSLHSLTTFASSLLSQLPLINLPDQPASSTTPYRPYCNAPSCPSDSPLSCHNSTIAPDSCCFIYPGGQLLPTQFWDTNPTVGPDDRWTLHGLWYIPSSSLAPPPNFLISVSRVLIEIIEIGPTYATALTPPTATQP